MGRCIVKVTKRQLRRIIKEAISESADVMSKLLQMDPKQAVAVINSIDSSESNNLLYDYSDAVEREYSKVAGSYRPDKQALSYWKQKRDKLFDVMEEL